MRSRKELKKEARDLLGNNIFSDKWLFLLLVILVESIIVGAISSFVIGLIFAGIFAIGIHRVLLGIVRRQDEKANFEKLFSGFSDNHVVDHILLGVLQTIFLFLWSLLFVIPGIIKSYSYAMSFYIQNDNPELDANSCITASRKMMKGHKWQLFVMDLSFLGWYIVGLLCFGFGVLWVYPYHELSKALFYEELKAQQNPQPAAIEVQPAE